LIAFGKATFEHAVPVFSFGVYMENKQNIIFRPLLFIGSQFGLASGDRNHVLV
jgi:hypothetical protein